MELNHACDLCIRTKTQRRQPVGELRPLPISDTPWDTVSVDFHQKKGKKYTYRSKSQICQKNSM
jgi:hypothetical protein